MENKIESFVWELHNAYNSLAQKAGHSSFLFGEAEPESLGEKEIEILNKEVLAVVSFISMNQSNFIQAITKDEFSPACYAVYLKKDFGGDYFSFAVCPNLREVGKAMLTFMLRLGPFLNPETCRIIDSELLKDDALDEKLKARIHGFSVLEHHVLCMDGKPIAGFLKLDQEKVAQSIPKRNRKSAEIVFEQDEEFNDCRFRPMLEDRPELRRLKNMKAPRITVLTSPVPFDLVHSREKSIFLSSHLPEQFDEDSYTPYGEQPEPIKYPSHHFCANLQEVILCFIESMLEVYRDLDKSLMEKALHQVIGQKLGFLDLSDTVHFSVPVVILDGYGNSEIHPDGAALARIFAKRAIDYTNGYMECSEMTLDLMQNRLGYFSDESEIYMGNVNDFMNTETHWQTCKRFSDFFTPDSKGEQSKSLASLFKLTQGNLSDVAYELNVILKNSRNHILENSKVFRHKNYLAVYQDASCGLNPDLIRVFERLDEKGQLVRKVEPYESKIEIYMDPLSMPTEGGGCDEPEDSSLLWESANRLRSVSNLELKPRYDFFEGKTLSALLPKQNMWNQLLLETKEELPDLIEEPLFPMMELWVPFAKLLGFKVNE